MAYARWQRGFRNQNTGNAGGGGGGGTPTSRQIATNNGLQGGGDLTADRTLSLTTRYYADNQFQNLTAAGGTQAAATPIVDTSHQVAVTGGTNGQGIRLPASPTVGDTYFITVDNTILSTFSTNAIILYPATGDKFRNVAANAGLSIYAWQTMMVRCIAVSGTATWEALQLPGYYQGFSELAWTPNINHNGTYINSGAGGIQFSTSLQSLSAAPLVFASNASRISFAANAAAPLYLGENGDPYIQFVSTTGAQEIQIKKTVSGGLAKVKVNATTTYTALVTDSDSIVELSNASAIAVTLPNNLPVGTCITFVQTGAGQATFASTGSGTVVNASAQFKTRTQESVVTAYVSTNSGVNAKWRLSGDTAA